MRVLYPFVVLSVLAMSPPLHAEPLHLALYGQRSDMKLRSGGADVDTSVSRLGLVITGIYSPQLEASLDLGHANLTQTGNPATQGMNLAGQYGGVAVRFWPLRSHPFDVWVQGDYGMQSVSGSAGGQDTEITWYDGGLTAGLVVHLGRIDLHGGARHGSLSGDEVANGNLIYTRGIELNNRTTSWIGVDLQVDPGGTIGVVFESGGRSGVSVRFARRF